MKRKFTAEDYDWAYNQIVELEERIPSDEEVYTFLEAFVRE